MRTRHIKSSSHPVPSEKDDPSFGPTEGAAPSGRNAVHIPVLLHESVELLNIQTNDVVLDATLGGAGHARSLIQKLDKTGIFIGIDLDRSVIADAQYALTDSTPRVELIEGNFRNAASLLQKSGIDKVDKALFDLGWGSHTLSAGKGFSFLSNEPLDMRYGESELTASTIVNTWGEDSLSEIIFGFGEERFARRIARAIVEHRVRKSIETASELAEIIVSAYPHALRHKKLHPATKTFQALRIAVNDELGALSSGLRAVWNLLVPNGRMVVISFHSIEDRIVKRFFKEQAVSGAGALLTKKPITSQRDEVIRNPRSRSAKLRGIIKN